MPAPIEAMERMERDYWGAFNQLRIISTRKRFQSAPPSRQELLNGWELYAKTKVLEGAYNSLARGNDRVYVPTNPALDILAKVKRKSYQEQNIEVGIEAFHRDVFGTGEGGICTYIGKIRGGRKLAATNFFYAMEDMTKEVVASVEMTPSLFHN